jgi:hypothetical protein
MPGSARGVAAAFAWMTAATLFLLAPRHLDESLGFGSLALAVALFLAVVAWTLLYHWVVAAKRAAGIGALTLLVSWIVVRALAPPGGGTASPAPLSLTDVLSRGAEVGTLIMLAGLASAAPLPPGRSRRARWGWGGSAALVFAVVFLLASTGFRIVPWSTKNLPYFNNVYDGFSLSSPFIIGMPLPHLWVVGAWSTFALTGVAAILVGANVAAAMRGRTPDSACGKRPGFLATAPAIFAVSACCGTPTVLFLGSAAAAAFGRVTPWLLTATVLLLALNLGVTDWRNRIARR